MRGCLVSDPIAFPDVGVTQFDFTLIDTAKVARMEGRRTETVYDFEPYWRASFSLPPQPNEDIGALRRFLMRRGTFLAHDHSRPRPIAYAGSPLSGTKAIGGAFNGDAEINDLTTRNAPTITGLPANFVLSVGDTIEFRQSVRVRSLHIVDADVTANASGVATVTLTHPVPDLFNANDTVHLEKPSCVMQVRDKSMPLTVVNSTFSFDAVEVFPR